MAVHQDYHWEPETLAEKKSVQDLRENILDAQILAKHCPLDHLRRGLGPAQPKFGLGTLNRLAIELQQIVLGELDVRTLLAFRTVSRRAVEVVNGMIEWQMVRLRITLL
jgi:hypothetical protein